MNTIFNRNICVISLAVVGSLALSACQKPFGGDVRRADTRTDGDTGSSSPTSRQ